MAIDPDRVCTDSDLEDYVLGEQNLQDLLPEEWLAADGTKKTAKPARAQVLRVVLDALKKRRPPVFEELLTDVTELKTAVLYGTLEVLYTGKTEHVDSPKLILAKRWGGNFRDEMNSLQPSVKAGVTTSSIGIRMSRG